MEEFITILIYIHAFSGGTGLIAGVGSVVLKKGSISHKRLGLVFSFAMILSSLISLVVASMPGHENLFLFLIGIFTIYMVLAGNRMLRLKNRTQNKLDILDFAISGLMLLASIAMVIFGVFGMIQKVENSILYLFFGSFGVFMTLKDFQTFYHFSKGQNEWLKRHLSRMIGALIASFTAFMVAGLHIKTLIVWLLPTILGTLYIIYWNRKLRLRTIG